MLEKSEKPFLLFEVKIVKLSFRQTFRVHARIRVDCIGSENNWNFCTLANFLQRTPKTLILNDFESYKKFEKNSEKNI